LFVISIFTNNQITPRRHGQVVRVLDQLAVIGLDKQFQLARIILFLSPTFMRTREVAPDLAFFLALPLVQAK
jgi:hypothetical protein